MRRLVYALIVLAAEVMADARAEPSAPSPLGSTTAVDVLDRYCIACHGPDKQEGDVRLDHLEVIDTVKLPELFVAARELVHLEEMPPEKAAQPSKVERKVLLDWLADQLGGEAAHKLEEKLQQPESGNYVDHEALFSGKHEDEAPYTYDRRWLISDFIFDEKFHRILRDGRPLRIDGVMRGVGGSKAHAVKLTNPFAPDKPTGLRYYANATMDSGQVQTMLANARLASDFMIRVTKKDPKYLPAINRLLAAEDQQESRYRAREAFLENHIERILKDVFQDEHDAMLPEFVATTPAVAEEPAQDTPSDDAKESKATTKKAKGKKGATATEPKKAKFHAASPGDDDVRILYQTLMRYKAQAKDEQARSDEALLAAAEREWFYYGHDPVKIKRRIAFFKNYTSEFWSAAKTVYPKQFRAPVYEPPAADELKVIHDAVRRHRQHGDTYQDVIDKCLAAWRDELLSPNPDHADVDAADVCALVAELFRLILERDPSSQEAEAHAALASRTIQSLGTREGISRLIQSLILSSEFVYRYEFGQGETDAHGRRMMSPRDASYAIAYALTDASPDEDLAQAAADGRLSTRADYEREVKRLLAKRDRYTIIDTAVQGEESVFNITNLPIREIRFVREFFAYPMMMGIFKDNKRFGGLYDKTAPRLVAEADRLVEHVLEEDRDVFGRLLTSDRFYVYHSGDNERMAQAVDRLRAINDYFHDKDWANFGFEDLLKHQAFIDKIGLLRATLEKVPPQKQKGVLREFQAEVASIARRFETGNPSVAPFSSGPTGGDNAKNRGGGGLRGPEVAKFYNIDLLDWDYPTVQPAPMQHRKGMLTHPAWLIAFSHNTETDPIRRGKWIRQRLLADTIPDVPITVDAVIPEDPHKTLRSRMVAKTGQEYCWSCHRKMDPLGLPFEMYDDFGRFRTAESLEYPENLVTKKPDKGAAHEDLRDVYKTLPVDSFGSLDGTGTKDLDGDVQDALDLIDRLAWSERVRQSIVRHAFRYFMGRNEMLSDSKTLIDADRAYVESGGSFDALIVSLLTSDSFIYRKALPPLEK